MGGIWGQASSTALENVPVHARGLISGFLQQGYAVGYLLAAVINLTVVPRTVHSWRALYWVGTGLSVFAAVFRAVLPESKMFLRAKELANGKGLNEGAKTKVFLRELGAMLKVSLQEHRLRDRDHADVGGRHYPSRFNGYELSGLFC
jgi:SHS family lactate transporter-like MFS transporter